MRGHWNALANVRMPSFFEPNRGNGQIWSATWIKGTRMGEACDKRQQIRAENVLEATAGHVGRACALCSTRDYSPCARTLIDNLRAVQNLHTQLPITHGQQLVITQLEVNSKQERRRKRERWGGCNAPLPRGSIRKARRIRSMSYPGLQHHVRNDGSFSRPTHHVRNDGSVLDCSTARALPSLVSSYILYSLRIPPWYVPWHR